MIKQNYKKNLNLFYYINFNNTNYMIFNILYDICISILK